MHHGYALLYAEPCSCAVHSMQLLGHLMPLLRMPPRVSRLHEPADMFGAAKLLQRAKGCRCVCRRVQRAPRRQAERWHLQPKAHSPSGKERVLCATWLQLPRGGHVPPDSRAPSPAVASLAEEPRRLAVRGLARCHQHLPCASLCLLQLTTAATPSQSHQLTHASALKPREPLPPASRLALSHQPPG